MMKALVWHGGQKFLFDDIPRPTVAPGRIVVKVEAAAVCGSDFRLEDFGAAAPLVPGHEVAGTVAEIGPGVRPFAEGDRVALDPVQTCGTCWSCTHDQRHLCRNYRHLGVGNTPGGWAEYVAIDAGNAHAVPAGLDWPSASLTEPMAVCYESFQRARLRAGDKVLVLGDGPFGFLHAQLALAFDAGKIVVAGHYDWRLQRIAAATGAVVCNANKQTLTDVLAAEIGSPGADIVIEATGACAAPNIGLQALRPRGTLVIFSYIWKPEPLEMGLIHMRELNVLGSCRSLEAYPACLALMSQRRVFPGLLIDLKLPLADVGAAQAALKTRKQDVFKVVFIPSRENN